MHENLKALGTTTEYRFDIPDARLLERFKNPLLQKAGWAGVIHIRVPEFTSLCPKTGQPDFATIVIDYRPDEWCLESKSLKIFLVGFRMHGEFHEGCVQRIANDLVALLNPFTLRVEGQFTPRGGIPFWPVAEYRRP